MHLPIMLMLVPVGGFVKSLIRDARSQACGVHAMLAGSGSNADHRFLSL